jgi:hypothetical protein
LDGHQKGYPHCSHTAVKTRSCLRVCRRVSGTFVQVALGHWSYRSRMRLDGTRGWAAQQHRTISKPRITYLATASTQDS